MAYVKNPDLTKAGIAVLAGLDASSAVEPGLGVTVEAAADVTVHGRRTVSYFPACQVYTCWCTLTVCKQSLFMSHDVHGLQRCLSQPSYTVCCP